MIDPWSLPQYDRSSEWLEEFALFAIAVAGKPAGVQARKVDEFLSRLRAAVTSEVGARRQLTPLSKPIPAKSPFELIRVAGRVGALGQVLRDVRLGQYARIGQAYLGLATSGLDLAECGVADLEAVHGVGPKTARFFVLQTRRGSQVAAIDTHLLKWLASRGHDVPQVTPSAGARYAELERLFILEARLEMAADPARWAGRTLADFDLDVWSRYARQAGRSEIAAAVTEMAA